MTNNNHKSKFSPFFKYSNIAFQMLVIIALSAWGGSQLDVFFNFSTPILTLLLTFVGVVLAMLVIIREIKD